VFICGLLSGVCSHTTIDYATTAIQALSDGKQFRSSRAWVTISNSSRRSRYISRYPSHSTARKTVSPSNDVWSSVRTPIESRETGRTLSHNRWRTPSSYWPLHPVGV